jgi:hypothetical protein
MIPFPLGSLDGSTRKSAMLRAWSTVILIAGLAMACMLLVMVPAESWPGPGCLVRKHAGIHCPGCGGTRAARHLVQGSWREASRSNLLIFPVAAGILWGIVAFSANRWTGTRWRTPMGITTRLMLGMLLVVSVFTLLRNLEAAWFLRP